MLAEITDQINTLVSSPNQNDSPKPLDTINLALPNRRATPLYGGQSTKIGGMWNLKHDISSPRFYELLIKTEIKGYNTLYLKNFYNHIKIFLNEFTIIQ